jgi:NADPH:quinone reductase-like Zn-dependent oxidoreductase
MSLQRVVRSSIIDAPIERVWSILRDFNSHDQWHSVVAQSEIEDHQNADRVGCVRNFILADGNHIREMLISLSDKDYISTYTIVEATVPLIRYVATVSLKPVTDGNRTFWHWSSTFETPPGMETQLRDMVAHGVYEAGFSNLKSFLSSGQVIDRANELKRQAVVTGLPIQANAIRVRDYGQASVMQYEAVNVPPPAEGEVRIRQTAVGVNYLDIYLRKGWIPEFLPLPATPGMEAAGEVIDVGPGVTSLLPGDRVVYMCPVPGSYTSIRNVPVVCTTRIPPGISDQVAAALLLKGVTADYLIRDLGHIKQGTRLLVHAAAGGVGQIISSWAHSLGALVIGTVSSPSKARIAREHGCHHVIVGRDYQFSDAIHSICSGVDVIIDGLGDAARDENFASLAKCGHWISLGQATGAINEISPHWLIQKSLSFSRPVAFDYVATQDKLNERAQRIWKALFDGILKNPDYEEFELKDAYLAHEKLESRQSTGSLLLKII